MGLCDFGQSGYGELFILWKRQDYCIGGGRKDVRRFLTSAPAPNDRLSSPSPWAYVISVNPVYGVGDPALGFSWVGLGGG
jgi:hypothetical protein